jgi:hypothetical protein
VVWIGNDETNYDIYYFDGTTKTVTKISDNNFDDSSPQINENGDVVWSGYDGTNLDIYYFDGTTCQGRLKKVAYYPE